MKTETTTLAQFIEKLGITMKAEPTAKNPHMIQEPGAAPMDHWFCTLRTKEGAVMGVHFSTGIGLRKEAENLPKAMTWDQWQHRPNYGKGGNMKQTVPARQLRAEYDAYLAGRKFPVAPTAADVLDCLASDASGVENARGSFEDWCAEYCYDTDSRKAEKTFRIVSEQAAQLKAFLGDPEHYEQLLWDTERL